MVLYSILPLTLILQSPVITEVASNPFLEVSGEFVEIYNPSAQPVCLEGFKITDGDALDELLPWDEVLYGPFPHSGMILSSDTIPPEGFALVFELDYPDSPTYDIPPGTLILTTGDHSICNSLAASSDPLTLFDQYGTADSNAVSTYGTPVPSDIWQDRDDDELDGIPFDPGEGRTVERFPWFSPDIEGSWSAGPEGGSPGSHAGAPPDTLNIRCDSVWCVPSEPMAGEVFQVKASFSCMGNIVPSSGTLTLFLDSQCDSIALPDEVLAEYPASTLLPGQSQTFSTALSLEQGWFLPSAAANVPEDEYPQDDFGSTITAVGGGINPVITEVLCNPLDEDTGEFIEIYYPGPGIFPLCTGCSFTDGDALDIICEWSGAPLIDPDACYGTCIPGGRYGLIFDPEYSTGIQEYDLAESSYVFTVENTTIGNGLTGTDPVTLYSMLGTTQSHVLSTYGTPLQFDDPLLCDDDGLDAIPFDPGEYHSVERKSSDLPDEEYCWAVSPEGGTPGCPAVFCDTTDAAIDSLILIPDQPQPGQPLQIATVVSNRGTAIACGLEVTIFIDSNADSLPQPFEICCIETADSLYPGETCTVTVTVSAPQAGYYLAAAGVDLPGDIVPENDILLKSFRSGDGVNAVVTEVLCNPSSEDTDEFIEIYYPGPGVLGITGCTFTDGDALDILVPWDDTYGTIQDPDGLSSPYLLPECYAVILDREYATGSQPWDFPAGTVLLTTGNTTLGDGITSTDPITLYSPFGTASIDVMSTYGTPVDNNDPLMRDDDGLDGIPFDPGEDNSVQRIQAEEGDCEENWFASPEGPTPGSPPPFIVEGVNATAVSMECDPPMGPGNEAVDLIACFSNTGTDSIPSGSLTVHFFQDIDCSGTPAPGELIDSYVCGVIAPGDTSEAFCEWPSCTGEMLLFAVASCLDDSIPADDTTFCVWNEPGPVLLNEIMYSPSPGDPEWVEIVNTTAEPVFLNGWTFEDSRDRYVFCFDSVSVQPDSFAVITSDSTAFRAVWPDVSCSVLQPQGWPVLNNSTQQGENWADILILRDSSLRVMDYVPYDDDWGGASGQSLEKLDPTRNGYEASNWCTCSVCGTPGETNSCCTASGSSSGRFLYYYPDPFSPDADGRDDILTIEMNFHHAENEVTLEIYNVQGRLLLQLLCDEICSASRTVTWDGTGDNGGRLPVGRYIIYLGSRACDTGEYRETCDVVVLARQL
jgi:hypothetical protein